MKFKSQTKDFPLKNHFIFWILFIAYEVIITRSYSGKFSLLVDYLTYYILNITLFYVHAKCLISFSFPRLKYLFWVLIFIVELLLYLSLKYGISLFYYGIGFYHNSPSKLGDFFREGIWRGIYFMGLGSAYGFFISTVKYKNKITELEMGELQNQIKVKDLENEKLFSDMAFLKAQINPHFIFNTLSLIHNDVAKHSEDAGELLLTLSDVIRYSMDEPGIDGKVSLEMEANNIENYIMLNQRRFNHQLNIDMVIKGEISGARVIPLIIITIIENIFKYGELRIKEHPAKINLGVNDGLLQLIIENKKRTSNYVSSFEIGMKNIRKRLELHYGGKYNMEINQTPETYSLNLYINLL